MYFVLENNKDLNKEYTFKKEDFIGLKEENLVTCNYHIGDKATYQDLLYCLLLVSGADSAKAISNTDPDFIEKMNQKANDLKMINTHFTNPIGLDDPNNYSTASDLLKLFKYAMKNKTFKQIISTKEYTTKTNKIFKSSVINKYILGGKAGTTNQAGLCLISYAKDKNTYLYLITLNAPYDKKGRHNIEDANKIYKYYFNLYDEKVLVKKDQTILRLKTKYYKEDYLEYKMDHDIKRYLKNYNKNNLKINYKGIKQVTPFSKNKLGVLTIKYKDELLYKKEIYKKNLHFSLLKFLQKNIYIFIIIIGGVVYAKKHKNA